MPRADTASADVVVARRLLPFALIPLAVIAVGMSAAPWLRVFPQSVAAVPLFGSAALSVLTPVVVAGIGIRRLWQTALLDVAVYAFFTTLVGLHDPVAFGALWQGLVHGPSEILTFALPLVSPRTLLVAPITLCWVAGTVIGECVGRGWRSALPYVTALVAFGLAYAGSVRGVGSSAGGRRMDVVMAASLLLTLLLMRAVESWLDREDVTDGTVTDSAVATERVAPARLAGGVVAAVVLTATAASVVGVGAFGDPPVTVARSTPLEHADPLSPVAFVASLRPHDPHARVRTLFTMRVAARDSNYVALADVDHYDGQGWTFDRTFRPSGGIIPTLPDVSPGAASFDSPSTGAASTNGGRTVVQQYTIAPGALTRAPWMPFQYRPGNVTGLRVDVDAASGMVVPAATLHPGEHYSVAGVPAVAFTSVRSVAIGTASPAYSFVPSDVAPSLDSVLAAFERETGVSTADPVGFLRAVASDLRSAYTLSGDTGVRQVTGGTGFATVLASILGPSRAATSEQYATLVALIARRLGVPSRVVTGFRVGPSGRPLRPGRTYRVTGHQAWTWVEIPLQGHGWAVLDASPSRTGTARRPQPNPAARPTPEPTPTTAPRGLAVPARHGHAIAPPSSVPGGTGAASLPVLAIVLGSVAAGVALAVGLLRGRRRLRERRRRRADDPRQRMLGAWHETLDLLTESGLPDTAALTSTEVADSTRLRFGAWAGDVVGCLGEVANAAIFSPSTPVVAAAADDAWRSYEVVRSVVREQLTRRERISAVLRFQSTRRSAARDDSAGQVSPLPVGRQ